MKKTVLISLGLLIMLVGNSQITVTANTPSGIGSPFNAVSYQLGSFGHWPLLVPGTTTSNDNKASAFIFETGDGDFYTSTGFTHNYSGDSRNIITVLSLSGRYDTIKFPPAYANSFNITGGSGIPDRQQRLSPGQNILLTPIAPNLNASDEMVYILTYKVPKGANRAKIIFFYNHQYFNVFQPCNDTSTMENGITSNNSLLRINRLRRYFNESLGGVDNSNIINQWNLGSILKNTTYDNNLSWDWNADPNQLQPFDEHNIFISIRTKENLPAEANGFVEAVLLYNIPEISKDGKQINNNEEYNNRSATFVQTTVSALPHDPNYIIGMPKCIQIQKGVTEKLVDFHIRCQNEGAGNAHKLRFEVVMDSRLKNSIDTLKPSSFIAIVGNRSVDIDTVTIKNDSTFILVIDNIDNNDTRNDLSLGNNKVANWFINPLTWGDIYFKLNIPVDKEADFISTASIFFYSGDSPPVRMPAVVTQADTLCVRISCNNNNMLFPRPIPIVDTSKHKIVPPPCTTCGCKKLGRLCWYWWLAIALGTVIIIWAIARKKKNDKVNDSDIKH